jgi:hypothetical protein
LSPANPLASLRPQAYFRDKKLKKNVFFKNVFFFYFQCDKRKCNAKIKRNVSKLLCNNDSIASRISEILTIYPCPVILKEERKSFSKYHSHYI